MLIKWHGWAAPKTSKDFLVSTLKNINLNSTCDRQSDKQTAVGGRGWAVSQLLRREHASWNPVI